MSEWLVSLKETCFVRWLLFTQIAKHWNRQRLPVINEVQRQNWIQACDIPSVFESEARSAGAHPSVPETVSQRVCWDSCSKWRQTGKLERGSRMDYERGSATVGFIYQFHDYNQAISYYCVPLYGLWCYWKVLETPSPESYVSSSPVFKARTHNGCLIFGHNYDSSLWCLYRCSLIRSVLYKTK